MNNRFVFLPVLIVLAACGGPPTPPTVNISSPSVQVYTKASVTIQVAVTGEPNTVELLKDGVLLATLIAPYQYIWDTTGEPEATYNLTARASKNGVTAPVVSAAKQITVDRTAPSVVSRSPANAATNVFLADEISLTFTEPMLASSITGTTVQLQEGINPIARNANLDTAGTKLMVIPASLPTLPATMNVVVNGITDRAGNVLPNNSTTLTAPDWQQPGTQPLDTTQANDAGFSEIATGANGQIFVVFREIATGNNRNVYVKKWTGSAWEALGAELDIVSANNYATNPDIAIQSNGNPIAAWAENNGEETGQNIYVKRWNGTAWEALGSELDITFNNLVGAPKIALNSSNNPIVVWSEFVSGVETVYVKRWNGTVWEALGGALDINAANAAFGPRISIFNNQPVVIWNESNNIYAKRWDGTTWQALGADLNTATSNSPDVMVAPDGSPMAVWNENNDIVVKKYNGTIWQAIGGVLDLVQANTASLPKIDMDTNGNPIVLWLESGKAVVKKWNGTIWVLLGSNLNAGTAAHPKLATDTSGSPVVSFTENADIFVKRYNRIP